MLKAILAKTIAAVRKIAQFVAKAALRVLRGIQPATPVNAFVASKRVVCGLRGAFFALLLMAASPLLSGDAYAHDAFAKECVEIGRNSSGIYPHYIRNLCDKTIKVGWCTHHSEGCDKFWGLTILGPGKKSHYIPTVDTNRRFTTTWGSCYHEQYYSDVVHIYPRTSGSEYICQHRHRNSNRSGGDNRSGGSSDSGGGQSADGANSCKYANDGECDEPSVCPRGTDTNDCGGGGGSSGGSGGGNSCKYANDGECDEPNVCPQGTDTNDCGSANRNSGGSGSNNAESAQSTESLRGTPAPTGTLTENVLRKCNAWSGKLNSNARLHLGGNKTAISDTEECYWYDKNMPLHMAIRLKDLEAARWMIANGVDVNAKGYDDRPPLYYAVFDNMIEIVALLIDAGADVNQLYLHDKYSPLDAAIARKLTEMEALLRRHGARCKGNC